MRSEFQDVFKDAYDHWIDDACSQRYHASRSLALQVWNHQQSKVDELQKRVDELEKTQSRFELKAEEAECVSMCLDDHGVAKCDQDGKSYSLWGRVCQFKKTGNFTEDDLERIYWEFDSERAKQGEERLRFKEALRILLEQALKGDKS